MRKRLLAVCSCHAFCWLLVVVLSQSSFANDAVDLDPVEGVTYSIGNGFTGGLHGEGSHFHSSNLSVLPSGNPEVIFPGSAEVGGFFGDEEVRGISEFEVVGEVLSAELYFDVFDLFEAGAIPDPSGVGGLFGQEPLDGDVDVFVYAADHLETVSDYQVDPFLPEPILTFDANDFSGGDTLSVDITSVYNDLAANGADLGIRLQMADADPDAGAITLNNFRLELSVVPEPSSITILLVAALIGLPFRRRR